MLYPPTTENLVKSRAITAEEVEAAVEAFFVKPNTGPYPIGGGYLLDLAAAVQAHEPSYRAFQDPDRDTWFSSRRTVVQLMREQLPRSDLQSIYPKVCLPGKAGANWGRLLQSCKAAKLQQALDGLGRIHRLCGGGRFSFFK